MADSREPEVTGAPSAEARSAEVEAAVGDRNFTQFSHIVRLNAKRLSLNSA